MKTTRQKTTDSNKKWYLIDAKDKVLGKVATKIADLLRGKNKPTFSPDMDCGEFVIVINSEKVKLTGGKLDGKIYYHHSGYMGNLKEETAGNMLKRRPTKVLELAVYGMLPKNKLRSVFMKKLKLYAGETHPHQAQNPEILEIKN